ncbi:MAG: NOL1/NOP2/sun family putative RNA methylase [Candidatus Nanoarchaeia archaeon]
MDKEKLKDKIKPKQEFRERIERLLGDEADDFFNISYEAVPRSIRVNTLKISIEDLLERLKKKGWHLNQPLPYKEAISIENALEPGELGKTKEHLLGYYYVQDLSSMLPLIALNPKPNESFLDLAASPGSKTTQAAAMMNNKGVIIANDVSLSRIKILNSNLEKSGVMNTIVVRKEGSSLCRRLKMRFDKILVDAPCSGEGTLRKSLKTFQMWNKNMIRKFSNTQKRLASSAIQLLKQGGEMVYSTCTLSPEENEEVIDYLLNNFEIEIVDIKSKIGLKSRQGITKWEGKTYHADVKKACRIYPQDNNTHGFFLAKIRKL